MKKARSKHMLEEILDYIFAILLIISCGSVYDNLTNVSLYISEIFLIILFFRVFYIIIKNLKDKNRIKKCLIFSAIYIIYQAIYITYHLIAHSATGNIIVYIAKMIFTFLLLFCFYTFCKDNKFEKILSKFSKLVVIISSISLFFFIFGSTLDWIKPTNSVNLTFGKTRDVKSYCMIYFEPQATIVANRYVTRNCAIFSEAPMFSVVLLISLAYELFINKNKNILNKVILYLTIISTLSTTGIVVAVILSVIKILEIFKLKVKHNKYLNIIYILIIVICIIVGISAIKDKLNSPSFTIRMDDYIAGIKAWNDHKILGNGYQNFDSVEKYMLTNRNAVSGQSNSLTNILAEGGIWNFAIYLIPFIYLTIIFIKEKKYKEIAFLITLLLIFSTSIITYTILIINFIAYGWSKMLKNKYKIKSNNINIYVATHKKVDLSLNNEYKIIQVGAEGKEDLGYLKDNTGDNISLKNKNYCELTALYWIWKNDKSDITGLVHYRRFFFNDMLSKKLKNTINKDLIEYILQDYDIIVPKKQFIAKYNLKEQYQFIHEKKDLDICRNIIQEKYSDYIEAFDKVFNQHGFYAFNMFITKKELIDKYCEWLFDVLFELEKKIDISSYDQYNQRIFGFLSERLFNVWIEKNQLIVKEQNVFNTEQNVFKQETERIIKKVYCKGK